jgi:hypothetical protein
VGEQRFEGLPAALRQGRRFDGAADAEGDLAVGQQRNRRGRSPFEAEPMLSVPRISGVSRPG